MNSRSTLRSKGKSLYAFYPDYFQHVMHVWRIACAYAHARAAGHPSVDKLGGALLEAAFLNVPPAPKTAKWMTP